MRHGFLAGATFVAGILLGTFFVAPLLQDLRAQRAKPVIAQQAPQPDAFEKSVAEGNHAMDEERYREAIAAYDRALAIRFDANVATDRGVCYRLLNEPERALAAFEFVTLKQPDYWKARYNRAVVLVQLGRLDEARAEAEKVAAQQPEDESVRKLIQALDAMQKTH